MNRESTWDECLRTSATLPVSADRAKAQSLIETARGRMQFLSGNIANADNANYLFEGYYSSTLEFLHALLLLEGYKVANHICLGYYLRDVLRRLDLFRLFDDCRYKRNALIYYGRKMDFPTAEASIDTCRTLIAELTSLLPTQRR